VLCPLESLLTKQKTTVFQHKFGTAYAFVTFVLTRRRTTIKYKVDVWHIIVDWKERHRNNWLWKCGSRKVHTPDNINVRSTWYRSLFCLSCVKRITLTLQKKRKKYYFLSSLKVPINTTDNDVMLWPTLLMAQSGVKICTFSCDTKKKKTHFTDSISSASWHIICEFASESSTGV